jgi:hypothetical protein
MLRGRPSAKRLVETAEPTEGSASGPTEASTVAGAVDALGWPAPGPLLLSDSVGLQPASQKHRRAIPKVLIDHKTLRDPIRLRKASGGNG